MRVSLSFPLCLPGALSTVQDLGVAAPVAPAQRVQRMQQTAVDWVKIQSCAGGRRSHAGASALAGAAAGGHCRQVDVLAVGAL